MVGEPQGDVGSPHILSLSRAITKAIVVDDRDGSDVVRQNAELGGYCTAKYTPTIKL